MTHFVYKPRTFYFLSAIMFFRKLLFCSISTIMIFIGGSASRQFIDRYQIYTGVWACAFGQPTQCLYNDAIYFCLSGILFCNYVTVNKDTYIDTYHIYTVVCGCAFGLGNLVYCLIAIGHNGRGVDLYHFYR